MDVKASINQANDLINNNTSFINNIADFVVDTGTSGIWTYRKWNSGIGECWGTVTQNLTSYDGGGSYLFSNQTYPFNFIESPVDSVSCKIGNGIGYHCLSYGYTGYWAGVARSNITTGSVSCTARVYVIGRWK